MWPTSEIDFLQARLVQDKTMLQQHLETTDAQIDRLLYGLTEEEIKIVQGA